MRVFVGFTRRRNLVLGLDLADYVEAVGSAVRRFKVGEAVIAFTGKHFRAYAEYVCLPAEDVRARQDALITPKPTYPLRRLPLCPRGVDWPGNFSLTL